jgi:F0F1-type ATP synthase assembly protein I
MSRQPLGEKRDKQTNADPGARPGNWLLGSAKGLQTSLTNAGPVAAASYTLIGAIVLLGGAGYFADDLFGTSPWLLIIGLLLGIVVGFYELVRTVWHRRP